MQAAAKLLPICLFRQGEHTDLHGAIYICPVRAFAGCPGSLYKSLLTNLDGGNIRLISCAIVPTGRTSRAGTVMPMAVSDLHRR